MDELWLIGRILYCSLFIGAGIGQLVDVDGSARYAVSRGVRSSIRIGVVGSALAFIVGGLSVVLGIWGDLGALLLIVTLIPLTFVMHKFWAERDALERQTQLSMFMKNIALVGGAVLLFSWFARDTFGFGLPYTVTDGAFDFR